MIKATADRNPELIKIPSHTPSLNAHATFQTGFITLLAVMQSFAPLHIRSVKCYFCEAFVFLNSVYVHCAVK